jgi:hypothetical protein
VSAGYAAIALTDGVRAAEARLGSAAALARLPGHRPADGGAEPRDAPTESERDSVAERDGSYLASTSDTGWPYVQFRGGSPGWNCHQHITPRHSVAELRTSGRVPRPDVR